MSCFLITSVNARGELSDNRAVMIRYECETRSATNIKVKLLPYVIDGESKQCLRKGKQYVSRTNPRREYCCRERQPE